MKKIIALLLASTLMLGTFTACNRNPEPDSSSSSSQQSATVYQDGTYSVKFSVPAQDRTLDYLTVTIKSDDITIDEYGCKEDTAAPASSDASSAAVSSEPAVSDVSSPESDTSATEAEKKAADHSQDILDTYEEMDRDLDTLQSEPVKGAEEHSYRFVRMMRTVLKQAKSGETSPVELGQYADGDYESVMPDFNEYGWKEFIHLTVKDGNIDTMDYNARSKEDNAKLITEDPQLNKEDSEASPSKYYPEIVQNYKDCGYDLTQLGAPESGAEATREFKKLLTPLLSSMMSGGSSDIVASRFFDGTYKAEYADFDEYGWKETVTVKIKNGKVEVTNFDAISKEEEKKRKSDDEDYAAKMKEKAGTTLVEAFDKLVKNFESADNDVTKIENVAGATVSSNDFKLLVGQILATAARYGATKEPLQVERMAADAAN